MTVSLDPEREKNQSKTLSKCFFINAGVNTSHVFATKFHEASIESIT